MRGIAEILAVMGGDFLR